MPDYLQDDLMPWAYPRADVEFGGLYVCCLRLIGRDGLSAKRGDTLDCPACLTRVVYLDDIWQWDFTVEYPPTLPLAVPPEGVTVEDPPEGGAAFVGSVDEPPEAPATEPKRTMMGPVPFLPAPVPVPGEPSDQQE